MEMKANHQREKSVKTEVTHSSADHSLFDVVLLFHRTRSAWLRQSSPCKSLSSNGRLTDVSHFGLSVLIGSSLECLISGTPQRSKNAFIAGKSATPAFLENE
jgi:hypothetical protein